MSIKYPFLPEGRSINYVPADNEFMLAAKEEARLHSTDRMQSTGAVVVRDGEILGAGANQVPLKNATVAAWHRKGLCVRKLFNVKSGKGYWMCPGCAQFSDHGERQALKNAIKKHGDISGSDLYLWGHWWCCQPCWNAMIAAGIVNVFLMEGSDVLFEKGRPGSIIGKQFEN